MNIDERIAQFENMAREDSTNEMAHFSLGNAYSQAGRFAEATASFEECIRLNENLSKAYQLCGAAYLAQGEDDKAADILTRGYTIAALRGDLMPKKAMEELLHKLGRPIPDVAPPPSATPDSPTGSFTCQRTGRPGHKMDRPPFRGPVGQWIYENISRETFDAWIRQGTKVINELRLDLSREEDADTYDLHMREYLGIDNDVLAQIGAS
ncbi:MAG: Fe(2+)-trafficking protein [Phycisphaeraceae bacterium]|nr:Fe(2+)-trafficking protein [Phycisphaerales bacterium]MCB9861338.1 Fe(2+)-trafficking protein [Phycisphaeraceae bacterium]